LVAAALTIALAELLDHTFKSPEEIEEQLGLVLKYRWLVLASCAVGLAIGFFVTFTSTPIYQATVTIQIDRQAARVVKVDGAYDPNSGIDNTRFYQTQYDLLRSRPLAERVVTDLDLAAASDFLYPPSSSAWRKLRSLILPSANTSTATVGKQEVGNLEQRKAAAASMVQGGLSVDPEKDSNLVRISFESPSGEWAARIANGVADSYVTLNLERRYGASANAQNFLKERLAELKLKLEESEKALVAYAEERTGQGALNNDVTVKLRELERTAAVNKTLFEDFLQKAKIADEQATFRARDVRVIMPAATDWRSTKR
jgi:uncharacterized protein involved in exopolysaccharide biosynthesis